MFGGRAVREVAAGVEAHAEDRVARLQQRQEHGLVRLRAGMRLDVGELAAEQLLGAVDGQLLGHVHELAAAVVAPARIAFGVFVGEHAALRLEHGGGDDVLARDQLDAVLLAGELAPDGLGQFGVRLREGGGEEPREAGGRRLLVHPKCSRSAGSGAGPGEAHL